MRVYLEGTFLSMILIACWSCFKTSRCITYHEFQGCPWHHSFTECINIVYISWTRCICWLSLPPIWASQFYVWPPIPPHIFLKLIPYYALMFSIEFNNICQTYVKRIYYHHCWICIQHSSWMVDVFFMYWTWTIRASTTKVQSTCN